MYSTKEKLLHFRQLQNALVVEADLELLKQRADDNSNLTRYCLAPWKNADDILFELLDVCTHEEIVINRREFFASEGSSAPVDDGKASEESSAPVDDGKAKKKQRENSKKKKNTPR